MCPIRSALIAVAALVAAGSGVVPAAADCTCVFKGTRLPLGERICLSRDGSVVTLQCRMNQNITSWVRVAEGCDVAAGEEQEHPPALYSHVAVLDGASDWSSRRNTVNTHMEIHPGGKVR